MALSLLKTKAEMSGFLKKAASAKGKDQFRGGWKDRWFVLKGHTLSYYKQKGDSTPKGTVDLRAAKVDDGDSQTQSEFTIRIAQSKQVFVYLQCSNGQQREEWMAALRKCAGYKMDKMSTKDMAPGTQAQSYCSFGVLFTSNVNSSPKNMVLMIDSTKKVVALYHEGSIVKAYPCHTISMVHKSANASSPPNTDVVLFSVSVDFKADNYLNRKMFWVGTAKDAETVHELLTQCSHGNFAAVDVITHRQAVHSGSLQLRDITNDDHWEPIWVVLEEERCLLYKSQISTVPWRAVTLHETVLKSEGSLGLSVSSPMGRYFFRASDQASRNQWLQKFQTASSSLKEKLANDFKHMADDDDFTPPPPSLDSIPMPEVKPKSSAVPEFKGRGAADILPTDDSFLVSWGDGSSGQLGHRNKDTLVRPAVVAALNNKKVRMIAAGAHHVAAVTVKGHVYVWGDGAEFQLGLGENRLQSSSPYLVTSLHKDPMQSIACGRAHTVAVTTDGRVFTWGCGKKGQTGQGSHSNQAYPKAIDMFSTVGKQVDSVAAGGDSSSAFLVGGSAWVWGSNDDGQLGNGSTTPAMIPIESATNSTGSITSVAMGTNFSMFLLTSGKLYVCGGNDKGQLGLGDTASRHDATELAYFDGAERRVLSVSAGAHHAVAVVKGTGRGGIPYVWGASPYNGLTIDKTTPVPLRGLPPLLYASSAPTHSIFIDESLSLYAFGSNDKGELGNGQPHVTGLSQVGITSKVGAIQTACGNSFSLVLCRGKPPADLDTGTRKMIEFKSDDAGGFNMALSDLNISGNVTEEVANEKIANLLNAMAVSQGMGGTAPPGVDQAADEVPPPPAEKKKKKKKKGRWKAAEDPSTGRTYYFHTKTKETRWIKPEEME